MNVSVTLTPDQAIPLRSMLWRHALEDAGHKVESVSIEKSIEEAVEIRDELLRALDLIGQIGWGSVDAPVEFECDRSLFEATVAQAIEWTQEDVGEFTTAGKLDETEVALAQLRALTGLAKATSVEEVT